MLSELLSIDWEPSVCRSLAADSSSAVGPDRGHTSEHSTSICWLKSLAGSSILWALC